MGPRSRPEARRRGLGQRLRVMARRKALILLCAVLVGAGAAGVSYLRTPVFEATAEVVLKPPRADLFTGGTVPRPDAARDARTEAEVVTSDAVRNRVGELLEGSPTVTARAIGRTDVIEITGRSSAPEDAADAANAYAAAYVDVRKAQAVDEILAVREQIQRDLDRLVQETNAAPPPDRPPLEARQAPLRARVDELRRLAEVETGGAEVSVPAEVPDAPSSPRPLRDAGLGLVAGLLLGTLVAGLAEALDDSVRSKEEFEALHPGVPVLGMIPVVSTWKAQDQALLVSLSDPRSPAAEAYRTLRTALRFLDRKAPVRVLQITSSSASEGKSTTAANLAVACAAEGLRVVLICCDLRRPRLHQFFGLSNEVGFTSVLLGRVPLSEALQEVPSQPGLFVLASGALPPDPSELLSSRRTTDLVGSLEVDADLVILDSPPLLPVTDGLILSAMADATLLVAVATSTTRKEVGRAVSLLRQVEAPLVGAVLNGVREDELYGSYGPDPGDSTDGSGHKAGSRN